MRWVVLSPHFDDAVFSCGAWIAALQRRGVPVAVWTVMAAPPPDDVLSPLAQRVHADWPSLPPRALVAWRQAEDRRALDELGADVVHLPWTDCIYRRDGQGRGLYAGLFTSPHPADETLQTALAKRLADLPADVRLLVPLAIGDHVDHWLVRQAAERSGRMLAYYADVPYALWHPKAATAAVARLHPRRFLLSSADVARGVAAAAHYRSQIDGLFGGLAALKQALHTWAGHPPRFTLWLPRPGENLALPSDL